MVLGVNTTVLVFFALIVFWLVSLTLLVLKTLRHYNRLTRETNKKSLSAVLETLLGKMLSAEKVLLAMGKRLSQHEEAAKLHFQKVGLIRFNPFPETGGEQSFTLGLLDENNSGIVLTSLQGRAGTRWYTKQVKHGRGVDFKLSKEEEEVVSKAKPFVPNK